MTITPLHLDEVEAVCCLVPHDEEMMRARLMWHLATPYACALKAVKDDHYLGVICGIVHGESGWIRALYMPAMRLGQGVGETLITALVAWMEEQGARTQVVQALPEHPELYARCGFVLDGEVLAYHEGWFLQATHDEVENMEPEHMMAVLHLDRKATGEDRELLLREHQYLGSVYVKDTRVTGFSLPLLGHGLIVAESPEVGLELQRWLLPIQPYIHLPMGHLQAHAHMITRKYVPSVVGIRMVRGPRPDFKPYMIYGHP